MHKPKVVKTYTCTHHQNAHKYPMETKKNEKMALEVTLVLSSLTCESNLRTVDSGYVLLDWVTISRLWRFQLKKQIPFTHEFIQCLVTLS